MNTVSVYGELDLMVEHRTQFAFKGKREHIAKVNIPNIAFIFFFFFYLLIYLFIYLFIY